MREAPSCWNFLWYWAEEVSDGSDRACSSPYKSRFGGGNVELIMDSGLPQVFGGITRGGLSLERIERPGRVLNDEVECDLARCRISTQFMKSFGDLMVWESPLLLCVSLPGESAKSCGSLLWMCCCCWEIAELKVLLLPLVRPIGVAFSSAVE